MGEENTMIDQSQLAEDLSSKIHLTFAKHFLVKPLEPIKVKKEFDKPVVKDTTPKADENGIEAIEYDDVKTEIKEVDSDFKRGVVLKVPFDYAHRMENPEATWVDMPVKVGDIVVYPARAGKWFDHIKDAEIIPSFDIIAVERNGI